MTYTLLLIAALVFAAAGWLAFAKEYRAHRATRAELARKTDRDPATGRFWRKPGEA
jgi:hypothetical protein